MSEHKSHQHQNDSNNRHAAQPSANTDEKDSGLSKADSHEPKPMPEALKDLAGGIVNQAKHIAETKVEGQKSKVADGLGDVAHALRQATSARHEPVIDTVRPYVEKAADQVERVSGYVQNATLRDMANDLESFARREPALFLGGAFALGVIGGRFLKAGSRSTSDSQISSSPASGGSSSATHINNNNTGSQRNDRQQSGGHRNDQHSNASSKNTNQSTNQKASGAADTKPSGSADSSNKAFEGASGEGEESKGANDPSMLVRDFSAGSKGSEVKANGHR